MPSRAYTFRITQHPHTPPNYRYALWKTHHLVNVGASLFGDWLLTFRGGLSHTLADTQPDPNTRDTFRRFLALSWLSVESKWGAPTEWIVAEGSAYSQPTSSKDVAQPTSHTPSKEVAQAAVLQTFKTILTERGVQNPEEWVIVCTPSLMATIRDDAVWVNRAQCFKDRFTSWPTPPNEDDAWDFLTPFLGDHRTIFSVKDSDGAKKTETKDFVQKAGSWLSQRFGESKGANFLGLSHTYQSLHAWATCTVQNWQDTGRTHAPQSEILAELGHHLSVSPTIHHILKTMSGPGYKSATRNWVSKIPSSVSIDSLQHFCDTLKKEVDTAQSKIGNKGKKDYANHLLAAIETATGFRYHPGEKEPSNHAEFAVLLDHAARRVSVAHTNMKKREIERQLLDVDKDSTLPNDVVDLLDDYVKERTTQSGAIDAYRIRKGALSGWRDLVKMWQGCHTESDRLNALKTLQSEQQDAAGKWGDSKLFEDMALDRFKRVIQDPTYLQRYQEKKQAEYDMQRFKIPMYRHPHSLRFPVYCDFGNSRFDVLFGTHDQKTIAKNIKKSGRPASEPASDSANDDMASCVMLKVWNGQHTCFTPLKWQSKRLKADITCHHKGVSADEPIMVSRADRLGRIVAGVSADAPIQLHGFDKKWGTRLQLPRTVLKDLEAHIRHSLNAPEGHLSNTEIDEWVSKRLRDPSATDKDTQLLNSLPWFCTVSITLEPQGPAIKFFETVEKRVGKQGSQGRFARYPGIRVMGVDLGHRHAAACAIWEACTIESVHDTCRTHGHAFPTATDAFCHVPMLGPTGKKTVVFRRIGPDTLPDDTPHPAPWARLDRQFLIKLQGEGEVRALLPHEQKVLHKIEDSLGLEYPFLDRLVAKRPTLHTTHQQSSQGVPTGYADLDVDKAMNNMVRLLVRALNRHAEIATIAYQLTLAPQTDPGGKKRALKTDADRFDVLKNALDSLDSIFPKSDPAIPPAPFQWQNHRSEGLKTALGHEGQEKTSEERAQALLDNPQKRDRLCKELNEWWATQDKIIQQVMGVVGRWIRKGKLEYPDVSNSEFKPPNRHKVGGLSLSRIVTMTEFRRKVQVSFATRPHPDTGTSARDEMEGFGEKTLQAIERLRDQRLKQLASRLIEGALGAGRVSGKNGKRPQESVDPPCHAIVIEHLEYYKPDELRTRRENRQLMNWSAAKIKTLLEDAAKLNGLEFWQESPAYTSRQDSRTGAPGLRCDDISVTHFLTDKKWDTACNKNHFLKELREKFETQSGDKKKEAIKAFPTLRLPKQGGNLFVSAHEKGPLGVQADLNAAANIGLKSLMDMAYPGKWWKVPCKIPKETKKVTKQGNHNIPAPSNQNDVEGTIHCLEPDQKVLDCGLFADKKLATNATLKGRQEIINLWRDIGDQPLCEGEWRDYAGYMEDVKQRVEKRLLAYHHFDLD